MPINTKPQEILSGLTVILFTLLPRSNQMYVHLTLCNPMDCSPPGSPVHAILQARLLEWVAIPPPEGLPSPGIKPTSLVSPTLAGRLFTTELPGDPNNPVSFLASTL